MSDQLTAELTLIFSTPFTGILLMIIITFQSTPTRRLNNLSARPCEVGERGDEWVASGSIGGPLCGRSKGLWRGAHGALAGRTVGRCLEESKPGRLVRRLDLHETDVKNRGAGIQCWLDVLKGRPQTMSKTRKTAAKSRPSDKGSCARPSKVR